MAEPEKEWVEGRGPAGWALEAVQRVARMPVGELHALIDDRVSIQARDLRGRTLYIGTEIFWDGEPGGCVRAIAESFSGIGDTPYPVLTDDVIVAPDGSQIGEQATLTDPQEAYALLAAEIDALYALSWDELRARAGAADQNRWRTIAAPSGRAYDVKMRTMSREPELHIEVSVGETDIQSFICNDVRLTREHFDGA